jgi:lysophospholipase L1-like esterase
MSFKRVCFFIFFTFLLFAITTLASELLLRLSGLVSTASIHTISEADFARIPGIFEPNQAVMETPHPRLHYHVAINSLGYRGPEIERDKPPHVVRILCLGDSGTFGQFVNDEETLSSNLEHLLRQDHPSVEVINGGVPGTTIVDQMEILKRSMVLKPDIVILTFSENDITDLTSEPSQYVALAQNRHIKDRAGLKTFYELVRDTALFNYFLKVRATWNTSSATHVSESMKTSDPHRAEIEYERLWARYASQLETMRQYLASRNIRLIFNGYPTHQRIGTDTFTENRGRDQLGRAEAMARKMDIPTVSTLPFFRETKLTKEELYHLPYDGHANKNGYIVQAKALYPTLRDAVESLHRATRPVLP